MQVVMWKQLFKRPESQHPLSRQACVGRDTWSRWSITTFQDRMLCLALHILLTIFPCSSSLNTRQVKPSVIVLIADDLGWSDIGIQKQSAAATPTIDAMIRNGILLTNHYAQQICSPSRAAFLTGKYPIRLGSGLDKTVFYPAQEAALSENLKLLPEYFKEMGYSTALIGKWHLGSSRWSVTPTRRGFDKFFGFYSGQIDYFLHNQTDAACNSEGLGLSFLDFRNQTRAYKHKVGEYSTDIFNEEAVNLITGHDPDIPLFLMMAYQNVHTPLQVPEEYLKRLKIEVGDDKRRSYLAMVNHLDDSIKLIKNALEKKNMWNNTIVVFFSDNGGSPSQGGYNWPLRGGKKTLWEGGIKSLSFLSGGYLHNIGIQSQTNFSDLVHLTDWFPTLLFAAGHQNIPSDIDGVNFWSTLQGKSKASRKSMLHNVNYFSYAYREGDWKLIDELDVGWAIPPEQKVKDHRDKRPINIETFDDNFFNGSLPRVKNGLYNIREDPFEERDISKHFPGIVAKLKNALELYRQKAKFDNVQFECDMRAVRKAKELGAWSPYLKDP